MSNPTTATFTDPTCGETCVLVIPNDVDASVWTNRPSLKIGVQHPRCGSLADLSVELDCFYCPTCGWNGRISGAWAVDLINNRQRATHDLGRVSD